MQMGKRHTYSDDLESNLTLSLWWLLWFGTITLLSIMFMLPDGSRTGIPNGQYMFFALTLLTTLGVIAVMWKDNIVREIENRFWLYFIVVFIAVLPSAISANDVFYSVRLLAIIFITTLPFVLLGWKLSISEPGSFLRPLFYISVLCSILTILFESFGPFEIGSALLSNHLHGTRWAFLFYEANELGMVCTIGIVAGLYYLLAERTNLVKIFITAVLTIILLFVFWKTNSRASFLWVGWAVGVLLCILLVVVSKRYGQRRYFWGITTVSVLSIAAVSYVLFYDDLYAFLRLNQEDITTGRVRIWGLYWEEIKKHPLFGMGFGSTAEFLKDEWIKSPLNVYVGLLGESGLVGFVPLLALWIHACLISARIIMVSEGWDNKVYLAIWVLMMLGGIALQQNGEWSIMRVSPLHYLFFFVLSISWSLDRMNESTPLCRRKAV